MSCSLLVVLWNDYSVEAIFGFCIFITTSKCTQDVGPNVGPMFLKIAIDSKLCDTWNGNGNCSRIWPHNFDATIANCLKQFDIET